MQEQLRSTFWRDDQGVVAGRKINPRHGRPLPVFADDVWDLNCIVFTRNHDPATAIADFTRIARPRLLLTAKELIAQRLNFELSPRRPGKRALGRVDGKTAVNDLRRLLYVFDLMSNVGVEHVSELTQVHLDLFLDRLRAGSDLGPSTDRTDADLGRRAETAPPRRKPEVQYLLLMIFDRLRDADRHLTGGGLSFDPWPGDRLRSLVGAKSGHENLTPRIDERVMGPLLAWCIVYVDHFSADILRAAEAYRAWDQSDVPRGRYCEGRRRLDAWASRLRQRGDPVPATRNGNEVRPCDDQIAYEAGVTPGLVSKSGDLIDKLVRELGLRPDTFGVTASVPEGASVPWRGPIDVMAINSECRHLMEACYVIVSYLSGMRDSEAQDLKPGCVRLLRDEFGLPYRYLVSGVVHKDADDRAGDPGEWTVNELVAKTIGVVERLCDVMVGPGRYETLFVNLSRSKGGAPIRDGITRRINEFIAHVASELAPRMTGKLPTMLGDPEDLDWHVKVTQFRRTIAWWIGTQPMGTRAGMQQFHHSGEVMFERYYGNRTPSGFAMDVDKARLLAAQESVLEMAEESVRGIHQAGPMGREIEAELASVAHLLGDTTFRGVVATDRERDEKLRHLTTRLHPGLLNDCVFEPSRAMCLGRGEERAEPIVSACDPGCPNAVWRKKHLPMLQACADDVDRMIGRRLNGETSNQKRILRESKKRFGSMIAQVRERRGE